LDVLQPVQGTLIRHFFRTAHYLHEFVATIRGVQFDRHTKGFRSATAQNDKLFEGSFGLSRLIVLQQIVPNIPKQIDSGLSKTCPAFHKIDDQRKCAGLEGGALKVREQSRIVAS